MTLDSIIRAAGLVDHIVVLDKLGIQYIAWFKRPGCDPTALAGGDTCEEALNKLAQRLDAWIEETNPPRAEQARKILGLQKPGLSVWQLLRTLGTQP